jgi:RHS repeat-associated protein
VSGLTTTHDLPSIFSNPSFSSSATTFSGGSWLTNSPNTTTYSYNVLDQIVSISQGSQTRTINYDALGRETSEITPEAGTVSFVHNDFGLATQRTDNRGVVTAYTYDQLNRMTGKSFPTVPTGVAAMPNNICDPTSPTGTNLVANTCFYYDQGGAAAFALGRPTKVVDPSGSETYMYDRLGQLTQKGKVINGTNNGNPYVIQYQFNLASEITQMQYPSGRQVKPTFDALGRISGIADTMGGTNTTYASGFQYNSANQMTGFAYGNGVTASYGYSADRLQITSLSYAKGGQTLFGLNYAYSQNAGNGGGITSITDTVDNGRSLTYLYDALGRLQQASTAGSTNFPKWDLAFGYDRYGNRLSETPQSDTSPNVSVPSNSVAVNAATNRISTSGYAYDASGNMINDGINTLTYDGENRVSTSNGIGGAGTSVYDAGGKRIRKCLPNCVSPTSSTTYIFSGQSVIAEYDNNAASSAPSREYINSTRGLLATIDSSGTRYHMRDHLSVRMTTDAGGSKIGEQGHFPFGESWYSANATTKWVFTGYERDPESANDYAQARVYVNRNGRFASPDPLSGAPAFPQSLNRYAYAANDPVNLIDPSGMMTCWQVWEVTFVWDDDPGVWKVKSETLIDEGCMPDASDRGAFQGGDLGGGGGGIFDLSPEKFKVLMDCIFGQFALILTDFSPSIGRGTDDPYHNNTNGSATLVDGLAVLPKITVTNDIQSKNIMNQPSRSQVQGSYTTPFYDGIIPGWTESRNPYVNYTINGAIGDAPLNTQIWELGNSLAFITGTMPKKLRSPGDDPGAKTLECYLKGTGQKKYW